MLEEDFEEEQSGRSTRRHSRARRVNAMQAYRDGTIDDRPIKERWSREFKNPKLKKIKDPLEKFDIKEMVEGLVIETHRRTCEVKLDERRDVNKPESCPNSLWHLSSFDGDAREQPHPMPKARETRDEREEVSEVVTAMYLATTTKELGEFPAVGDRVLLGKVNDDEDTGEGVGSQKYCVVRVLPRKSALTRPGPKDSVHRELTLAANIDQVVIVASVKDPEFNYGFADRFLLAASLNNLPFLLVLTKTDLVEEIPETIKDFTKIVDTVIKVSSKTGEGVEELRALLKDKVSVFSGQSGVGKSTLINRLIPDAELKTGHVREKDGKGRHTTTSSSLLDLPEGGIVIDTPGIRSLGIVDLDPEVLAGIFPGFFPDGNFTCKFGNCLHIHEPGCAVRKAVEDGTLSKGRYDSYVRILNSKD